MHSQHQAYSLSHRLASLLRQSNHTLAVAESCTAGGLSQVITAVDGASAFFTHGFVTYSNEAKQTMLGVPKSELETDLHNGRILFRMPVMLDHIENMVLLFGSEDAGLTRFGHRIPRRGQ